MKKQTMMKNNKVIATGQISLTRKKTLCIDFGDTMITITKVCRFDGKDLYSWACVSPTEGTECDWSSELIQYDVLVARLSMLETSDVDNHAIKLFVE
jgi:hypothetical protein